MIGHQDRSANLEVKYADLSANPYLLLVGMIAAGQDGVARGAVLGEEITGDPARFEESELTARGIRRLPTSLTEAVEEFEGSPLLRDAYGDALAEAIVAVRRGEVDRTAGLTPDQVAEAYRWVF